MKFPRQARLTRPAEFKRVFESPVVSSDPCFRVLARQNSREISRLGMAVSKKSCRLAVERNRIKRSIRESFRARRGGMSSELEGRKKSMDIVVLPTRKAAAVSNKLLRKSLDKHWHRITSKIIALEPERFGQ